MKDWKRIEPTKVTKVGWRAIVSKTFELPDGTTTEYDLFYPEDQEFVSIFALTSDHKVVVAREYAPGPEKIMEDLPGGFVDKGEEIETCARRELREETGYEPKQMKYLGAYYKDRYNNATVHAFLATGCVRVGDQELGPSEFIEVALISIEDFLTNVKHNLVTDHGTILAA
ncbi:MAG TPA: NUDIX hydrolase, partial [Candidatus Saccharimonadales bacterium]